MSDPGTHISISFDRKRLRRKLWLSVVFMIAGFLYIFMPLINTYSLNNPHSKFSGIFFIIISLILAFHSLKRLTTSKPGFFFDSKGIDAYSGVLYGGPILWSDITNIKIKRVFWEKMIMIYVNDSQTYIRQQKNFFNKITMSLNDGFLGSPFCIYPGELNIHLNDLFIQIDGFLKTQRDS